MTNSDGSFSLFTRWGVWLGNEQHYTQAKYAAWSCALDRKEPVDIYLDGSSKRLWTEMPEVSEYPPLEATLVETWSERRGQKVCAENGPEYTADGCSRDETDALRAATESKECVWPDHWPAGRVEWVEEWLLSNPLDYFQWSLRAAKLTVGWDKKSTIS